jgi:hypothetical protein
LQRFWFEFDLSDYAQKHNLPAITKGDCGVTALNEADALLLMEEHIFPNGLPRITTLIEDVDVSTLDRGHVLPNMGNVLVRGIWYPLGFTPSTRLSW